MIFKIPKGMYSNGPGIPWVVYEPLADFLYSWLGPLTPGFFKRIHQERRPDYRPPQEIAKPNDPWDAYLCRTIDQARTQRYREQGRPFGLHTVDSEK